MAKAKGRIVINEEKCKGCALCVTACPLDLISISEQISLWGYHPAHFVDMDTRCTGCALCARMCPDVAITVYRYAA
ncbi:MAG: 4Fe-4S binding protein [Anaerolineae bacterium]